MGLWTFFFQSPPRLYVIISPDPSSKLDEHVLCLPYYIEAEIEGTEHSEICLPLNSQVLTCGGIILASPGFISVFFDYRHLIYIC